MFKALQAKGFEFAFVSHADAILAIDFPQATAELTSALAALSISIDEIIGSGGGEIRATQRLRRRLAQCNWCKQNVTIAKSINGVIQEATSHEIDMVRIVTGRNGRRYRLALEIEWNNKDPFFDRDLENFKRLHAEGAISVGIIVTRGLALQEAMRSLVRRWADEAGVASFADLARLGIVPTSRQRRDVLQRVQRVRRPLSFRQAWVEHFVADKFGSATTHWRKLGDCMRRGVGSPCPLALIGLPPSIVTFERVAPCWPEGALAPHPPARDLLPYSASDG